MLMGEEAGELLRHRFEIFNVWRPIRGQLRDAPLATASCNRRSADHVYTVDLHGSGLRFPARIERRASSPFRAEV
jgi:hypothetical protein